MEKMNVLSEQDLKLTAAATQKLVDLLTQADVGIEGIRVFAQPGGCSGISFGMTFSDKIGENDLVRENEGAKVIVGSDTIEHLRGAEIDFIDRGDGQPSFVFNNIPAPVSGGGCGSCASKSSSCG
jgi:iron-sulfur cluster insertion protein